MISVLGSVTVYVLAGPNLIKLQVYYHGESSVERKTHGLSVDFVAYLE